MQKKFTIKKNTIKVSKGYNTSSKTDAKSSTVTSSSITKKSVSDDFHINIITATNIDASNYDRLKTPIYAETMGGLIKRRRRRAVKDLTFKSAPPVPTAPKDPKVRRRQWMLSQIKSHVALIDFPTAILSLILAIFGVLAIYSATLTFETKSNCIVQSAGILMGIGCALIFSIIDYRSLASKYRYIIAINAALLLFTYIFGSSVTEGTNSNWIDLGIIKIQPSEFAKLLFIYSFAVHLAHVKDRMHKFMTVMSLAIHACLIFALVLLQKDLGSLTIFLVIFISMCFAAGISIWYYIAGASALVCISPFIWRHLSEYQKNRIMLCFDESIDPLGQGIRYQQLRSQTAIGNGGILGTGFTEGTVTQGISNHLPAKHTDMIFSTICEEWGFIGALFVLTLTVMLILRVLKISRTCGNMTGCYICIGIASMLMIQVVENVGMCLGIMPVIGITYPFLSYGGSSVLSCFMAIGMVLSVTTHTEKTFFK